VTASGAGRDGQNPAGPDSVLPDSVPFVQVPAPVATLCREYAVLTAAAVAGLADFLDEVAALAVRLLPTARFARIRVREPEVVTAIADAPGAQRPHHHGVLAIPLVGRGDLTGVLELAPAGGAGFPVHERELAEVLAALLTLSLGADRAA
jgi:GAF domain-containing protein